MPPRFNIQNNSSDTLPEIPPIAYIVVCISGHCIFGIWFRATQIPKARKLSGLTSLYFLPFAGPFFP